jgi:hypothetical protein
VGWGHRVRFRSPHIPPVQLQARMYTPCPRSKYTFASSNSPTHHSPETALGYHLTVLPILISPTLSPSQTKALPCPTACLDYLYTALLVGVSLPDTSTKCAVVIRPGRSAYIGVQGVVHAKQKYATSPIRLPPVYAYHRAQHVALPQSHKVAHLQYV